MNEEIRVIIGYIARDILIRKCQQVELCRECPHSRLGKKDMYVCCLGNNLFDYDDPTISLEAANHLIDMCLSNENCVGCQYYSAIGNACILRNAVGLHPKNWRNLEGKWRVAVMGGPEDGKY